jgi:hypothetical protein
MHAYVLKELLQGHLFTGSCYREAVAGHAAANERASGEPLYMCVCLRVCVHVSALLCEFSLSVKCNAVARWERCVMTCCRHC